MKKTSNTIKLIGNTPIHQIEGTNIFVKLEKYNVGGSVKDRAVLGMLKDAMEKGQIKEDSVIVEATSGNTGIALSMLGAVYKIPVTIIMLDSVSEERRQLIKAYGAKLVLTPGAKGMSGALEEANRLLQEHDHYISLEQFSNPQNPKFHYETTGKEILEQVPDIDIFVAGIGTGGTFSGVAKRLKEYNSNIQCMAGEPESSAVISGRSPAPHKIQGLGANFIPENFDRELADDVMLISNEDAFAETAAFAKETGILVGISSGANIALAKRLAKCYPNKNIVTIAPDGGEKYLSVLDFDNNDSNI